MFMYILLQNVLLEDLEFVCTFEGLATCPEWRIFMHADRRPVCGKFNEVFMCLGVVIFVCVLEISYRI